MADKRIDQLTAATSLTAVDLMVTEQSGVAKKVTGDILANSAWNMMQKDVSPIEDSTAPITSGAVASAIAGNIDETLSVQGKAADAKATGDAVGELKSALDELAGEKFEWDVNTTRDLPNVLVTASYNNWNSVLTTAAEGDIFYVKGSGGYNSRLWVFADSTGASIAVSTTQLKTTEYIRIVAPAGTSYLACNSRTNDGYPPALVKPGFAMVTPENAITAETAINAGFEPVTANGYMNNAFMTNGGSVSVGNPNTVVCPAVESYSGQIYAAVSIPIKDYLGKGYRILVTATNQNRSGWYFNEIHISRSPSGWGSLDVLNLTSALSPGFNEKSTVVIDLDSYELDPSSYSELYLLYGAFRGSGNVAENTLTVDFKVLPAGVSVIATRLLGFDPDDYYTKAEIDALIDSPDVDILCWGDSLTAGAGGGGTNYPAVCANALGKTYKNCGVGGETANTISARQGGNSIIIPAGAVNGTYALDALEDVFGSHVNPLRQGNGSNSGNKIFVNGYECNLAINQSSSTATDATYTISGYTGPALTIPAVARFAGSDFTGKIVTIFVGQNGASFTGLSGVDARIAIIDSMIKHIGHDRYVILGLSSGANSSRDSEDNQLLAHYGNKFFPTRKLLVEYGLTINGLTPTAQDTADISAGTVPTSLRSDGVHMNAYGYTAIGKMLADKIRSLGYV